MLDVTAKHKPRLIILIVLLFFRSSTEWPRQIHCLSIPGGALMCLDGAWATMSRLLFIPNTPHLRNLDRTVSARSGI